MAKPTPNHMDSEALTRLDRIHDHFGQLGADVDHIHRLATVGTMAAGMAHEVNNILTPALAYLQLAHANPDDPGLLAKALEKAISSIESTTHIARAMLDFSTDDEQSDRSDIGRVVGAALDCLARDPAKDGIFLEVSVPEGLQARIRPHALQQVILNLVMNACSAMGRNGQIRVSAIARGNRTRISVTDTGPGIPEEIAGRIFEPFVSNRRKQGGTGLGLAVCRHLVEQAGGTIALASSPDRGTTFDIDLPSARIERAKAG